MKNLIAILAIALYCSIASAQWTVGPKVAIGTVIQSQSDFRILPMSDHGIYDLTFTGGTSVRSIGLMAYRELGPFFLQTEVLGTTYGQTYKLDNFRKSDIATPEYKDEFYILEIPITAGIVIQKNFKLGVGHVLEILADKKSDFSALSYYKDTSKNIDHGFQLMLGYHIGAFHVDMKYVNRFSSIADGFNFGSDDMKLNKSANRLTVSLGVAF